MVAKDLSKQGQELELFDDSDMTMIMMMVMMVVMMMAFIGPLTRTVQAGAAAQAYTGNEDPRDIHVTNLLSWINLMYDDPHQPWISAYIINDGPSAVEIGINYPDDRFTMNPGETITVTRSGADERIRMIYFICRPGLVADLRVTGVY